MNQRLKMMLNKILIIFLLTPFLSYGQERDIFYVARNGTLVEIEKLYKLNPELINATNEYGFTPLILSCYNGNQEIVNYLVSKNVTIDYVSDEGTALMAVTVKGNVALVDFLLSNGANPNLTNASGMTALMYAVQFKNIEIIKLLLANKSDKLLVNNEGKTAFEFAVFSKNEEIINLLK